MIETRERERDGLRENEKEKRERESLAGCKKAREREKVLHLKNLKKGFFV